MQKNKKNLLMVQKKAKKKKQKNHKQKTNMLSVYTYRYNEIIAKNQYNATY